MAGLALDVLDLFFIAIQASIPHRFGPRMAVDAVQRPLAAGKLGNGLVIIMQPVRRLVLPRLEGHRAEIIVASVVAGVALGIGDGCGQLVDLGGCIGIYTGLAGGLGRGMAGRTTGKMIVPAARLYRRSIQMTGETVLPE